MLEYYATFGLHVKWRRGGRWARIDGQLTVGQDLSGRTSPYGVRSSIAYYEAVREAGITRRGGIHTLRHCFATHLLEAGAVWAGSVLIEAAFTRLRTMII